MPVEKTLTILKLSPERLFDLGLLEIGTNTQIDDGVWLCHYLRDGSMKKVIIGDNCIIRAGSVIYSDVTLGNNVNIGQNVVIREGCRIGNNSSIGTAVCIECYTTIGEFVSIETSSHVTAYATIEDYVFFGACVVTNNDFGMKYKREGHGKELKGPTVRYGARIGSNAIIMAGVEIGKHSIVNAGEVVRKNVPDNVLMFTSKDKPIYRKIPEEKIVA